MMNRNISGNRKPGFVCDKSSMDSAHGSHHSFSLSQSALSQQSEFSQVNTQDMFTQNFTVSEADNSLKRMSIYEKWLSKRSLKSDCPTASSGSNNQVVRTPRCNGQINNIGSDNFSTRSVLKPSVSESQRVTNGLFRSLDPSNVSLSQAINHTKATVQEERDHVEQMHRVFMESKAEVINMLSTVKEKMDITDESNDHLGKIVTTFLDDIWKHEEKIMAAVLEQNKTKNSTTQLEQELAEKQSSIHQKECEITALKESLGQAKKNEVTHVAKAVKNEMTSPFVAVEQKLEDVLKFTNEAKEQNIQLFSECKKTMDSQRKNGQTNIKDLEKRLIAEIRKIMQNSSMYDIINQLKEDMQQCMDNNISNMEHQFRELEKKFYSQNIALNKNAEFMQQKMLTTQDILRQNMESISNKIESIFYNHVQKQDEHLSGLQKVLIHHAEQLTARQTSESSLLTLLDNRLSSYQADVKHCLAEVENTCLKQLGSFPGSREKACALYGPSAGQNCSKGHCSSEYLSNVTNPRALEDIRIGMSTVACETHSVKDKESFDPQHDTFEKQKNAYTFNETNPTCGDKSRNDQEFGADILRNQGQSDLYLTEGNYVQNSIPFSYNRSLQSGRKNEQEENVYKQKNVPFVSPFRSEYCFKTKTGPSPVAAIIPQRHIERSEKTVLTLSDIAQTSENQMHEQRHLDSKTQMKQKKKKARRKIFSQKKKHRTRNTHYVMEEEEATVIVNNQISFHSDANEKYNSISVTERTHQGFPPEPVQPFGQIGNTTSFQSGNFATKQKCTGMSEVQIQKPNENLLKIAKENQLSVYDFNDCESQSTSFTSKKRTYPWAHESALLKRSPAQKSTVSSLRSSSRFSSPVVTLENIKIKRKIGNVLRTPQNFFGSSLRGQSSISSVRKSLAYSPTPTLLSDLTT